MFDFSEYDSRVTTENKIEKDLLETPSKERQGTLPYSELSDNERALLSSRKKRPPCLDIEESHCCGACAIF